MPKKKKILIVDDEKFFIEPVKRLLEGLGYEVHEALDGIAGLSKARSLHTDHLLRVTAQTLSRTGLDPKAHINHRFSVRPPVSPRIRRPCTFQ